MTSMTDLLALTDVAPTGDADAAAASEADPAIFDGVDLRALSEHLPTPFHAYSSNTIRNRVRALQRALHGLDARICYAVKANPNVAILQLLAEAGVGADIVSLGELRRSLHAGIPASRCVFSGVGKSEEELGRALAAGVARFNVESRDELLALQRIAFGRGVVATASVRINPDVDARTHAKISTGRAEDKFGVGIDEARRWFADAGQFSHVRLDGLHVHIGSQILSLEPFRHALRAVAVFWRELLESGHAINSIDVGGGLGVGYRRGHDRPIAVADYVGVIREQLDGFRGRIVLEPGRWLVADAGVLLSRVIRVKPGRRRQFLVLDAAMNDLLRTALYEAWHDIVPLVYGQRPPATYDVVGPVCETGDTFAVDRQMPECTAGDVVMIATTGAYGSSMSSTYNSRPLAAEVLLDAGRYAIVRRRQSFEEMVAGEQPAEEWHTV